MHRMKQRKLFPNRLLKLCLYSTKVIMLGLYFGNSELNEIVEEYFRFYFTEAACPFAEKFVNCLESTLSRSRLNTNGVVDDYPRDDYVAELPTFRIHYPQKAERAYELANEIKNAIPQENAQSDRFRMLYLRSVMDKELCASGGKLTKETEKAAKELEEMFYAQHADYAVCPITEKAIRENRGHI